jgi:hypothetical protein
MEFESTLYRLKVAQIVTLPHAPTSPGACARGRAGVARSAGAADRECGARAGADARAGRAATTSDGGEGWRARCWAGECQWGRASIAEE